MEKHRENKGILNTRKKNTNKNTYMCIYIYIYRSMPELHTNSCIYVYTYGVLCRARLSRQLTQALAFGQGAAALDQCVAFEVDGLNAEQSEADGHRVSVSRQQRDDSASGRNCGRPGAVLTVRR